MLGRRGNVAFFVVSYLLPVFLFDYIPLEGDRCVAIGKKLYGVEVLGVTAYQRS